MDENDVVTVLLGFFEWNGKSGYDDLRSCRCCMIGSTKLSMIIDP